MKEVGRQQNHLVGEISKKVQESKLKWYEYVLIREVEYVGKRVMVMKLNTELNGGVS